MRFPYWNWVLNSITGSNFKFRRYPLSCCTYSSITIFIVSPERSRNAVRQEADVLHISLSYVILNVKIKPESGHLMHMWCQNLKRNLLYPVLKSRVVKLFSPMTMRRVVWKSCSSSQVGCSAFRMSQTRLCSLSHRVAYSVKPGMIPNTSCPMANVFSGRIQDG